MRRNRAQLRRKQDEFKEIEQNMKDLRSFFQYCRRKGRAFHLGHRIVEFGTAMAENKAEQRVLEQKYQILVRGELKRHDEYTKEYEELKKTKAELKCTQNQFEILESRLNRLTSSLSRLEEKPSFFERFITTRRKKKEADLLSTTDEIAEVQQIRNDNIVKQKALQIRLKFLEHETSRILYRPVESDENSP